jgi:hypothetical protein
VLSLSQSQPEGLEYAFCLSSGGQCTSSSGRQLTIPFDGLALFAGYLRDWLFTSLVI